MEGGHSKVETYGADYRGGVLGRHVGGRPTVSIQIHWTIQPLNQT